MASTSVTIASEILAEKKKLLQDKLIKRNLDYKIAKDHTERKIAQEGDVLDVEGLQLFRPSYDTWRKV